jgi:hypothetical protein
VKARYSIPQAIHAEKEEIAWRSEALNGRMFRQRLVTGIVFSPAAKA